MSRGGSNDEFENLFTGVMPVPEPDVLDRAQRTYGGDPEFLGNFWLELKAEQPELAAYIFELIQSEESDLVQQELYFGVASIMYDLLKRQLIENTTWAKGKPPSLMMSLSSPFDPITTSFIQKIVPAVESVEFNRAVQELMSMDGNADLMGIVKTFVGGSIGPARGQYGKKVDRIMRIVYGILRKTREGKR